MKRQESFLTAQQAEGYSSTIKHELLAPIKTIIFFIKMISKILENIAGQDPHLLKIQSYCVMVKAQLVFLQTFVDDILVLK